MDSTRDGRIQTLNLLQHWFAWQLILRLPPRRHVRATAAHGRCGVISRHITTRVFTLLLSGLSQSVITEPMNYLVFLLCSRRLCVANNFLLILEAMFNTR